MLVVQKFGGTSVGDLSRIRHAAKHISQLSQAGTKVVVIVSAMGEQTDELLRLAHELNPKPPGRELDMLLSAGERITMALFSIALDQLQCPAVSLTGSQSGILTDEAHGNAKIIAIKPERIQAALDSNKVVIVAGFQGVSPKTKEVTTLGRGGSDLTAVAIAAQLRADRCELYKDVVGIMSADPRHVKSAQHLRRVSFALARELTWAGAGVVHARAIHLASISSVPLIVRSGFDLSLEGTEICKQEELMEECRVEALTQQPGLSFIGFETSGSQEDFELHHEIRVLLWEQGFSPLIHQAFSAANNSGWQAVAVPTKFVAEIEKAVHRRMPKARITKQNSLATVSLVGCGFRLNPGLLLETQQTIKTPVVALDASDTRITLLIAEQELPRVLPELHAKFIG